MAIILIKQRSICVFNEIMKENLLNAYVFKTLGEMRTKAEEYMDDSNNYRLHKTLNYQILKELLQIV